MRNLKLVLFFSLFISTLGCNSGKSPKGVNMPKLPEGTRPLLSNAPHKQPANHPGILKHWDPSRSGNSGVAPQGQLLSQEKTTPLPLLKSR